MAHVAIRAQHAVIRIRVVRFWLGTRDIATVRKGIFISLDTSENTIHLGSVLIDDELFNSCATAKASQNICERHPDTVASTASEIVRSHPMLLRFGTSVLTLIGLLVFCSGCTKSKTNPERSAASSASNELTGVNSPWFEDITERARLHFRHDSGP